jgi:hypothetical protein
MFADSILSSPARKQQASTDIDVLIVCGSFLCGLALWPTAFAWFELLYLIPVYEPSSKNLN